MKLALLCEEAPAEAAAKGFLGKVRQYIEAKLNDMVVERIVAMANENSKVLIDHLQHPTKETAAAIAGLISKDILKSAIVEVAGQFGLVAGVAAKAVMKLGGGQLIGLMSGKVANWIATSLVPGQIPDQISSKSKLLRSFDLPDGVADKMNDEQKTNLMLILNILRNKPGLFSTEWDLINAISSVASTPKGGAGARTAAARAHKQNAYTTAGNA